MYSPSQERGKRSLSLHKHETLLVAFFGLAFFGRLFERLAYAISLAKQPLDFAESYALTEWLINYSGGFVRRGLPGEILHGLYRYFAIPPNFSIAVLTVSLFLIYGLVVWRKATDFIPRWALLTSPLLGFPVYMGQMFLRKDIFILLMLIIAVVLVTKFRSRFADAMASICIALLVVSHEIGAFLVIPSIAALMVLREVHSTDLFSALKRACPNLLWLILPIAAFLTIAVHSGTKRTAAIVASSWRSAYNPQVAFPGPSGAISWLGKSVRHEVIPESTSLLNQQFLFVPYWLILVLALLSGIILVASAISLRSQVSAWFFVWCVVLQFLCLSPLFILALDHARWVILALNSGFLLTILTPRHWQERWCQIFPMPSALASRSLPAWVIPVGLAFWGLPFVFWNPYAWLVSAPIGVFLQIYFYLRVLGLIPALGKL